jgi:hypothetical protein
MKICTIILNRNLPKVTDTLVETIKKNNDTDIYVVESGSDKSKISKYCTWYVRSKSVKKRGLRFPRGMNFALSSLYKEGRFNDYDLFFLLTNDTVFKTRKFDKKIIEIFKKHSKLGILSPCAPNWGEKKLLKKESIKYFWYIHNNAIVLRKDFIKEVFSLKKPGHINFLYDGTNFRGYGTESEIIAKAYINNWAAAITSDVLISENENYLIQKSKLIKTEPYDLNMKLYIDEGIAWMKKKYSFKNRWFMQMYVKMFYDNFFEINPNLKRYKI